MQTTTSRYVPSTPQRSSLTERDQNLRVRVTLDEKNAYERSAIELGLSLSDWVRIACNQMLKLGSIQL